jgi:hypothetical protein
VKYGCGTKVMLGDEIMVSYGLDQESLARVVAIGSELAVDEIDQDFYSFAKKEGMIDKSTIVIEWLYKNPLDNDDSAHARNGNYLTLQCLCCEKFVRRSGTE